MTRVFFSKYMRQCKKKGHTNKMSRLKSSKRNIDPEEKNSKHTNQVDHNKKKSPDQPHSFKLYIVEWKIPYIQNPSNLL